MSSKENQKITVTVDNLTVIRLLFLVFSAFVAFLFLKRIMEPLVLIIVSAFLAIGLNPAVSWIARKLRLKSRVTATGIAYLLVVGFLVTFSVIVFPPIVNQTIDFVKQAPETIQELRQNNKKIDEVIKKYNIEEEVSKYTKNFGSNISNYSGDALSTAGKVSATIAKVFIVFVLTFMMLVEGPEWIKKYFGTLSQRNKKRHQRLAQKMYRVIVGYFNGQVIIAAAGGFFAAVGLFVIGHIMHVPVNAIALGGIVALFALMPMIGTTIGASIVVLSIAVNSVPMALIMAGFFFIYQHIENITIQPYIQSKNSSISPLIVFMAALIGVAVSGLLGALLAIPVAGCLKVYIDDYFAQHNEKPLSKAEVDKF